MSGQKTLLFSNIQIYAFILKKKNPLLVVPQHFVKMDTKNWKSVYFFSYKFPIGQMHIGLLFVQRNEMSPYLQQNLSLQKRW